MLSSLMVTGGAVLAPLAGYFARLHAQANGWLSRAQTMPESMPEQQKSGGFPTWAIVLIVGAVLVLCVLPFCVIAILTLLGPAIGNVFSNIIENMQNNP